MPSTKPIDRDRALTVAAEYRVDVKKFWCDPNGNFSVWFYSQAERDDIMDGKIDWATVPENMPLGVFLAKVIGKEHAGLVRSAEDRRPESFLQARRAAMQHTIGDLVC